eukprot:scaffold13357_cov194-Alexandrium_tamarense.AAC.3
MSRLEAEELANGLLNTGVGGAQGVDDQIYLEEVAQGRASPALRQKDRQNKLVSQIEKLKHHYTDKMDRFSRLTGLKEGNPLEKIVNEAVDNLNGMEDVMEGKKGKKMPGKVDIKGDFIEMLHRDKQEEMAGKLHKHETMEEVAKRKNDEAAAAGGGGEGEDNKAPHLYPKFPPLPAHVMAEELFGTQIITDTLSYNKPTIAGIIAILQRFLRDIHQMEVEKRDATAQQVIDAYFAIVNKDLVPLEEAYRDTSIFPIREDGSIFMSLGAYRDHLLGETLRQAFKTAAHPEKLFVGAVVQNCFGIGVQCRTGVEVIGKDDQGRPMTAVSDRPPDVNGIEEFCTDPEYVKYCDAGQIRALYVNETESNGPTTARYFASKLWGGETYFLQADAHLRFAPEWDRLYEEEVKAAKSFPKAILSSYPPGFSEEDPPYKGGSRGTRLCTCEFSTSDVEHKIIRINTGNQCVGEEVAPTQIAYIAAGFFFTRAEFLIDVPFDPFLPW